VTFEVIVLAMASALRPAGVAALYALLSASHPRRVLLAYILGGFAFSLTVGVIVVVAFEGADIDYRGGTVESLIELVGGAAALGYAAGLATGRAQLPSRGGTSVAESRMLVRLQRPSVGTAAAAGVATHLPGLFYIIALNGILAHRGSLADAILAVLLFNVIWYGAAILSVLYFMVRPGKARRALIRATDWARAHSQGVTVFLFAVVGAYLVVDGALALAT
jgi:Sap-like sulfolipid-1-addressing protein